MSPQAKIIQEYALNPYEWNVRDCITLTNALLASYGLDPVQEGYSSHSYEKALQSAQKAPDGGLAGVYDRVLLAHPAISLVSGAYHPFDLVLLQGELLFKGGGTSDTPAMLGVVGPDFAVYTFRDVGLREVFTDREDPAYRITPPED